MARLLGSGQILGNESVLVDYENGKYNFRALPKGNANFVFHGTDSDKGDIL
jgi:hypothetical protein